MSLAITTMPDNPKDWPLWLEAQLVGDRLGEVVAELSVFQQPSTAISLSEVIGKNQADVLAKGLCVLSPDQIRQIIAHPKLLFALQELVLIEGCDYWQKQPVSFESLYLVEKQWHTITEKTSSAIVTLAATKSDKRRANPWLVAFATAASVLAAVIVFDQLRVKETPQVAAIQWGWSKPDALPNNADAKEYYTAMANAGAQWGDQRPENSRDLARRISEFRQGCSTLLLAEHKPLNPQQKKDLIDRCHNWAKKLDDALAKLESEANVENIRSDVDSIVRGLVEYLTSEARKA